jgi:DNA-binding NarL/FixJ family response regulator
VTIRLLLVDDHPIVLQGLQQLFERHEEFQVAAVARTAAEALSAIRNSPPDIVVLDLRMPGGSGIDVLRGAGKGTWKAVLLTAAIREEEIAQVLELGASGIVLKESSPDALMQCVREVHQGKRWIDPELARAVNGALLRRSRGVPPEATLTPRERDVVRLVAEGLRNKEIAERLAIGEGTVKIHLHNIYDKLGVDGRLELVLTAQQKGLV